MDIHTQRDTYACTHTYMQENYFDHKCVMQMYLTDTIQRLARAHTHIHKDETDMNTLNTLPSCSDLTCLDLQCFICQFSMFSKHSMEVSHFTHVIGRQLQTMRICAGARNAFHYFIYIITRSRYKNDGRRNENYNVVNENYNLKI